MIILDITLAACFAFWFAGPSGIPRVIKRFFKTEGTVKPFDCCKCMGLWIGLMWFPFHYTFVDSIIYAGCTSLLAYILENKLLKIL